MAPCRECRSDEEALESAYVLFRSSRETEPEITL